MTKSPESVADFARNQHRGKRRIAEGHRTMPPPANSATPREGAAPPRPRGDLVTPRSLAIYDAVGRRLAAREIGQ